MSPAERRPLPSDRRARLVAVTAEGRKLLRKAEIRPFVEANDRVRLAAAGERACGLPAGAGAARLPSASSPREAACDGGTRLLAQASAAQLRRPRRSRSPGRSMPTGLTDSRTLPVRGQLGPRCFNQDRPVPDDLISYVLTREQKGATKPMSAVSTTPIEQATDTRRWIALVDHCLGNMKIILDQTDHVNRRCPRSSASSTSPSQGSPG